ncbi:SE1832 family protein, partial [Staphylococcus gallinarum]
MDLNQKLIELKHDYVRLQGDLEKRESVNQQTDPLLKQLD